MEVIAALIIGLTYGVVFILLWAKLPIESPTARAARQAKDRGIFVNTSRED